MNGQTEQMGWMKLNVSGLRLKDSAEARTDEANFMARQIFSEPIPVCRFVLVMRCSMCRASATRSVPRGANGRYKGRSWLSEAGTAALFSRNLALNISIRCFAHCRAFASKATNVHKQVCNSKLRAMCKQERTRVPQNLRYALGSLSSLLCTLSFFKHWGMMLTWLLHNVGISSNFNINGKLQSKRLIWNAKFGSNEGARRFLWELDLAISKWPDSLINVLISFLMYPRRTVTSYNAYHDLQSLYRKLQRHPTEIIGWVFWQCCKANRHYRQRKAKAERRDEAAG